MKTVLAHGLELVHFNVYREIVLKCVGCDRPVHVLQYHK